MTKSEEKKEKGLKFGDLFPNAYESELQQRLEIKDVDDDLLERMKEKMLNDISLFYLMTHYLLLIIFFDI